MFLNMRMLANLGGEATLLLETRSGGRFLVSEQVGRREEKVGHMWPSKIGSKVSVGEGSQVDMGGLEKGVSNGG